jgi:hypothetical protein
VTVAIFFFSIEKDASRVVSSQYQEQPKVVSPSFKAGWIVLAW